MVKVDIYIELEDGKWKSLDMFSDESINLNMKLKDMTDLEKVFSPYTQDFSIPASDQNNNALRYYFNTEMYRRRGRAFPCKIFVGDALFKVGKLKIKEGQFENFGLTTYKCEFRTSVAQLKELIGEDTIGEVIGDWLNENISMEWSDEGVYDVIVNGSEDNEMLIPLISTSRVWQYKTGDTQDISDSLKGIRKEELRPAIKLSTVVDRLLEHYALKVQYDGIKDVIEDDYIWLNMGREEEEVINKLSIVNPFLNYVPGANTDFYSMTPDDGGVKVVDTGDNFNEDRLIVFGVWLRNFRNSFSNQTYDGDFSVRMTNRITGEIIVGDGWMDGNDGRANIRVNTVDTPGFERFFDFELVTEGNISIDEFDLYTSTGMVAPSTNQIASLDNPAIVGFSLFDIKGALSTCSVLDLFTSIFKMYNVRVVEDDLNESSKWMLPTEFRDSGKTVDLNKNLDVSKYPIKPSTLYKNIVFTHAEADYFRNITYRNLVNKEYGSEIYESTDDDLTESYTVETTLSIMNWFTLNETNLKTSYGFDDGLTDDYEPSELTIMRFQGRRLIRELEGLPAEVKFVFGDLNQPTAHPLPFYMQFGNQSLDGKSITFDIDIEPLTSQAMTDSLYSLYYERDIQRLYYDNANYFTYEGYLTAPQMLRFNMADVVIVEDREFTIEEASLDIATGKVKLLLLNLIKDTDVVPVGTFPPLSRFTAVGGFFKITGTLGYSIPTSATHYEIQYVRQDTLDPWQSMLIPITGQTVQPYTISNVTPAGVYRVRSRMTDMVNSGAWTTINNVNVQGRAHIVDFEEVVDPCGGIISTTPIKGFERLYTPIRKWDYLRTGVPLYTDAEMTFPFERNTSGRFINQEGRRFTGVVISGGVLHTISNCVEVAQPIKYTPIYTTCSTSDTAVFEDGFVSGPLRIGSAIYRDVTMRDIVKFDRLDETIMVDVSGELREVKIVNNVVTNIDVVCNSSPSVNEFHYNLDSHDELPQISLRVFDNQGGLLNGTLYYTGLFEIGTALYRDPGLTVLVETNPLESFCITGGTIGDEIILDVVDGRIAAIMDRSELAGSRSFRIGLSLPKPAGTGCGGDRLESKLVFYNSGDWLNAVLYKDLDLIDPIPGNVDYLLSMGNVEGAMGLNNLSELIDYKSCAHGVSIFYAKSLDSVGISDPCSVGTTSATSHKVYYSKSLELGSILYADSNMTTSLNTNGDWLRLVSEEGTQWVKTDISGEVIEFLIC